MGKNRKVGGVFARLHYKLRELMPLYGFVTPTRIQEETIPLIMEGKNVIISSPTGTGKTEAALLPIFSFMLEYKSWKGAPLLAYITPLRALNRDIYRRMIDLSRSLGFKTLIRHGDSDRRERSDFISSHLHWFITTPETFSIMMGHYRLRERLSSLKWVVLDEIHELIDSERGSVIAVVLERLRRLTGGFQFIGLSATISDPEIFRRFYPCRKTCSIVKEHSNRRMEIKVLTEDSLASSIQESRDRIYDLILSVAKNARSSIIFTNTRDTAEYLGFKLRQKGFDSIGVHHGSLSLGLRKRVETGLREGEVRTVISTSSLELGIDIGNIDLVIQYGSPRQAVRLYQRIGRSGHRVGLVPRGVIIAEPFLDDIAESIVISRRTAKELLEKPIVHENPLDVLLNQIIGIVIGGEATKPQEILDILKRTYPFRKLDLETLEKVIGFMIETGMLYGSVGGSLRASRRAKLYYYTTTMIPDTKSIPVYTVYGERIGFLDESFVAAKLDPGSKFLLAGREWQVIELSHDKVIVEEVIERTGLPPSWQGELIPVSWNVARETCSLISRLYKGEPYERLVRDYPSLTQEAFSFLSKIISLAKREGYIPPNPNYVLIESGENSLVIYTCLGSRGNSALSLMLATDINARTGHRVAFSSDAYRIYLSASHRLKPDEVIESINRLSKLNRYELKELLEKGLRRSFMFDYRVVTVARKMGIISRDASMEQIRGKIRYLRDTIVGEEALREILTEKMDVEAVSKFLYQLSKLKGGFKTSNKGFSPFTLYGSYPMRLHALESETLPRDLIIKMLEKRILSKKMRLFCLKCGWSKEEVVGGLPERPRCPVCGSMALAPVHPGNSELLEALERGVKKGGRSLRGREKRLFEEGVRRANLVLSYGKNAIVALTPYGVGVRGASRALSRLKLGWEEFLWRLYIEERNFFRTRRFWS